MRRALERTSPDKHERRNAGGPPDARTKTALVISAHAADFVWRCGGAIALHAAKGYEVTVVCLSFGERGESAKLWKEPGMTLERVKAARRAEAEKAAKALGVHDLDLLRPRRLPAAARPTTTSTASST